MMSTHPPVLGMILKGYPRISETFISNEILLLERLGFSIHIFSMRHPRETFSHRSVKAIQAPVDYLPQTLLAPLPKFLFYNAKLAAKRPRHYRQALELAVRRFRRTRKSATIKHLFQAGYLVNRLLPKSGVTHFHAHFAHSPTSVAMFASLLSGLEFSFTAHAKDIYTSDPRQLREKIGKAKFVVTCTEYNRSHLAALADGASTPIHRVYHGIDISLFAGGNGSAPPEPPYRILTVARMAEKKGLPTVYNALRILKDRGIHFRHVLIGDGDDRDAILGLIDQLGLTDDTEWLGTQPHDVVLEQYRRADLFVLGCRQAENGDRDGIPNVFAESMAMGVPVVATRLSAIPEIIDDGRTGLMVEPEQPEALAKAMIRLLTDGGLRRTVVDEARQRVTRHFDNTKLVMDLADIYRQAGIGAAVN